MYNRDIDRAILGRNVMINYWFLKLRNYIEESLAFDETGQTLVEYALIIAFVAIAIIGALTFLGVNLRDYYEVIANMIP